MLVFPTGRAWDAVWCSRWAGNYKRSRTFYGNSIPELPYYRFFRFIARTNVGISWPDYFPGNRTNILRFPLVRRVLFVLFFSTAQKELDVDVVLRDMALVFFAF